ncbi:uncharacterized protein Z519_06500 [Cladophialophora bantiana CBS 173.52]|uniref:Uncharacterized protein n=1 Tax=Cladophialophora bantiana (strain ATCC 10958 / CBS 173.52 / CDC B-1940 / NIH 8579) TaxID=1442370 RepID=A0A0D2HHA4_CLAB1|nr:uncharacterized protein Z519_06500 [Cladophialophora bantiana CBS 173.52]KIW92653.1 hypothetical protein Z519_06500 [Cladophialophora bantiana CBS 173.52]
MSSVDRLSKIAERVDLASQVRTLEVHRHYLKALPFDECIRVGHLAGRLRSMHPLDAALYALKLSRAYKDELDAQLRFSTDGPALLSSSLKKFPRLECFVHRSPPSRTEEGDCLLDEDSDLLRRTGIRTLDGGTQYLLMNSALQKCRGLKPVSIDLPSFYWWEFYNCMEIPHAKELFERCPLTPGNSHWKKGLAKYLAQLAGYLPAAEHLWLGFDELPAGHQRTHVVRGYALTRMTSLLLRSPVTPETFLPRLNSLTLENTAVRLNVLCDFIAQHSKPLRSLSIINIRLSGAGGTPSSPSGGILALVMKLILFLNKETQLDRFSMQGAFLASDGSRLLCSPKGKDSILHEVEEYVCHRRGDFPFHNPEMFLQALDTCWRSATVAGNKVTIPGPHNCRLEITLGSDDSWYIEAPDSLHP